MENLDFDFSTLADTIKSLETEVKSIRKDLDRADQKLNNDKEDTMKRSVEMLNLAGEELRRHIEANSGNTIKEASKTLKIVGGIATSILLAALGLVGATIEKALDDVKVTQEKQVSNLPTIIDSDLSFEDHDDYAVITDKDTGKSYVVIYGSGVIKQDK